jgi:hypothetical protein
MSHLLAGSADTSSMTRPASATTLLALLVMTACSTELGGPVEAEEAAGAAAVPAGVATTPNAAAPGAADADADGNDTGTADDVPADGGSDAGPDDTPASDAPATDDVIAPPAETAQACTVWQDCGPHFGDLNSGFDCDAGQCACNVAGDHDDACAAIGGFWSEAQCFCFVTSSRPPADADPDSTDDVRCWWDWYEECEPDEWVDTSYYRRECDDDGCRNVYVRRGYWRSGHCEDIWVRECSDGTTQEFR